MCGKLWYQRQLCVHTVNQFYPRQRHTHTHPHTHTHTHTHPVQTTLYVCVCVCSTRREKKSASFPLLHSLSLSLWSGVSVRECELVKDPSCRKNPRKLSVNFFANFLQQKKWFLQVNYIKNINPSYPIISDLYLNDHLQVIVVIYMMLKSYL